MSFFGVQDLDLANFQINAERLHDFSHELHSWFVVRAALEIEHVNCHGVTSPHRIIGKVQPEPWFKVKGGRAFSLSPNLGTRCQIVDHFAAAARLVFSTLIERGFQHLLYVPQLFDPGGDFLQPLLDESLH